MKLLILCRASAQIAEATQTKLRAAFKRGKIVMLPYSKGDGTFKFPAIHKWLTENQAELEQYTHIMLPDADIDFPETAYSKLSEQLDAHSGYEIYHPAITPAANTAWRPLRVAAKNDTPSNFTEIMCPIFTKEALTNLLSTFTLSYSGWALNFIWAQKAKCCILYDWVIEHQARPSSHTWKLPTGESPVNEMNRLMNQYRIAWPHEHHDQR